MSDADADAGEDKVEEATRTEEAEEAKAPHRPTGRRQRTRRRPPRRTNSIPTWRPTKGRWATSVPTSRARARSTERKASRREGGAQLDRTSRRHLSSRRPGGEPVGAPVGTERVAPAVALEGRGRVRRLDLHPADGIAGVAITAPQPRPAAVEPVQDREEHQEDQVEVRRVVPGEVRRGNVTGREVGTRPASRKSSSVNRPAVDIRAQNTTSMRNIRRVP